MGPAAALIVDCACVVHVTLLVGWQRPQRRGACAGRTKNRIDPHIGDIRDVWRTLFRASTEWWSPAGPARACHAACPVTLPGLLIERLRTADEAIAPVEKSQLTVGGARNADPLAQPDLAGCLLVGSEPQRAGLAEVDAVQPAIDP
jgi:hypothetical protein